MSFTVSAHTKTEIKRDVAVFVAALVGTCILDTNSWDKATLTAAIVTAVKVAVRQIFQHQAGAA